MDAHSLILALDTQLKDYKVGIWVTDNIGSFNWITTNSNQTHSFICYVKEDEVPFSRNVFKYNMKKLGYHIDYDFQIKTYNIMA